MIMKKAELLSPAGNMASLHAAVYAGCDAVYLGGYMFGARSFAGNFSNEELMEAIRFAHIHGVKVYVTVNTLIYENEVEMFLEYIDFLHRNNVDAIIMQDVGMMDLVRRVYPNLEIHASTQMHVHNMESAKFVESLGLKRAVLARETSLNDIKQIKEKTNIELEIFIHGALCISYSGQCLMSKMIGGRSGNRGACAGSCRLPYEIITEKGQTKKQNKYDYVLSMKDLNSLEYIEELLKIGIDSLKIEGRMKRPEYVYLVTSIYRKALDSFYKDGKVNIDKEDIKQLQKIYHRDFTKGFLFGEDSSNITNDYRPNHLGVELGKVVGYARHLVQIKLCEKVSIHDGIRIFDDREDIGLTLNDFYKKGKLVKSADIGDIIEVELKRKPVLYSKVVKTTDSQQLDAIHQQWLEPYRYITLDGILYCNTNEPLRLEVTDGKNKVTISLPDIVPEAKTQETTEEEIKKQMNRLKDTCYRWNSLIIKCEGHPFLLKSKLNELRRQMVSMLTEQRCYQTNYKKASYQVKLPRLNRTHFHTCYIESIEEYQKVEKQPFDRIYINNQEAYEQIKEDSRVVLRLERALTTYPKQAPVMVSELGGVSLYKDYVTDTSLNVVNSYALAFLYRHGANRVTLSYELEEEQIKEMLEAFKKRYGMDANVEVVIEGYPEILISKVDLKKKYHLPTSTFYLKDRKKKFYFVKRLNGLTHIYHSDQIHLNQQRLKKIGVTNFCIHK